MMMCPNCEQLMNVGTTCTVCGHRDRDANCSCPYCQRHELSECCKAPVIRDYMGDPSVPGCTMSFPVCSKCHEPTESP